MDATPVLQPLAGPAPASWRGELRALLALAGPLVGANLLQMAIYATDVIFVARLGTEALAATALGVNLYVIIMFALMGLVTATAPVMAAELGRRRHAVRQVRRTVRMGLWLSVLAALPFMLVLAHGRELLLLIGQDPAISAQADSYLDILLYGLPLSIAATVLRIAVSALGRPGWAMAVTALAVLANAFGNWLLIFGHWGLPAMGVAGAALASVITGLLMVICYVVILSADRQLRRYHLLGNWWCAEWPRLVELVRIGVPIGLTMTFEGAVFSAAAFLMGLIGTTEVAAHAIELQIAAITFQVPFGIAQAATIRVGMGYGAADRLWIARAGAVALAAGIGFMALTAITMLAVPVPLLSIYIDVDDPANAPVLTLAVQYLLVGAAFQLFDGAQAVAAGILRGLQDTRVPMIIAGLGYWVPGFGGAVLFGFGLAWEGVGIWIGLAIGLAVVSLLLGWRWHRRAALGLLPAAP